MLGELLGLFRYPVTTFTKRAEEKNIKKEAIIAAVLAVIIAVVTVLSSYFGIVKTVNKKYKSLSSYNKSSFTEVTKEEFKDLKKEYKSDLLEDANLVGSFFKTLAITVVAIAVVGAILFVIARLLKSPKGYMEMLTMSNSAFIIYTLGFVLYTIFSFIYMPVGIVILFAALIFAIIALSTSFRESIEVEDTNKLVICSSIVLTIVVAILVIIVASYINNLVSSLNSLSSLSSFLN